MLYLSSPPSLVGQVFPTLCPANPAIKLLLLLPLLVISGCTHKFIIYTLTLNTVGSDELVHDTSKALTVT